MMGTFLAALAGYTMFLAVDNTVGKLLLRKGKNLSFFVNTLLLLPYFAVFLFLLSLVEG